MAYSEDELLMLETEEDESVPDREQDVKPLHYKAKTHTAETGGGEENEVDEDEDEDDDDDDDVYGEWTLRKCAAASLDVISNTFGNDILAYLLPALNKNLSSPEWKYQESSILAMGAIAEGTLCKCSVPSMIIKSRLYCRHGAPFAPVDSIFISSAAIP